MKLCACFFPPRAIRPARAASEWMRGTIGSSQTLEQHVPGLLFVIYEDSQPQPSLCSRDAGGVPLLKMLFHLLLDLRLSECIKELHLDGVSDA